MYSIVLYIFHIVETCTVLLYPTVSLNSRVSFPRPPFDRGVRWLPEEPWGLTSLHVPVPRHGDAEPGWRDFPWFSSQFDGYPLVI